MYSFGLEFLELVYQKSFRPQITKLFLVVKKSPNRKSTFNKLSWEPQDKLKMSLKDLLKPDPREQYKLEFFISLLKSYFDETRIYSFRTLRVSETEQISLKICQEFENNFKLDSQCLSKELLSLVLCALLLERKLIVISKELESDETLQQLVLFVETVLALLHPLDS